MNPNQPKDGKKKGRNEERRRNKGRNQRKEKEE
jgi:hypothetical protein